MQFKFSRHAKRRIKLYKIPESTIIDILKSMNLFPGEHETIKQVEGFRYPLKIAFVVENDIITIVTSYPLKRRRKR